MTGSFNNQTKPHHSQLQQPNSRHSSNKPYRRYQTLLSYPGSRMEFRRAGRWKTARPQDLQPAHISPGESPEEIDMQQVADMRVCLWI